MDWLSSEIPMVGAEGKIVRFLRSTSLEDAFPRQFHDNECLEIRWYCTTLVRKLYYFKHFSDTKIRRINCPT